MPAMASSMVLPCPRSPLLLPGLIFAMMVSHNGRAFLEIQDRTALAHIGSTPLSGWPSQQAASNRAARVAVMAAVSVSAGSNFVSTTARSGSALEKRGGIEIVAAVATVA